MTTTTTKLFRDLVIGDVILKSGKRYGVVTEIDRDGGFCAVRLDKAGRTNGDHRDDFGIAVGTKYTTSLVSRRSCDDDAPMQPGFSIQ